MKKSDDTKFRGGYRTTKTSLTLLLQGSGGMTTSENWQYLQGWMYTYPVLLEITFLGKYPTEMQT